MTNVYSNANNGGVFYILRGDFYHIKNDSKDWCKVVDKKKMEQLKDSWRLSPFDWKPIDKARAEDLNFFALKVGLETLVQTRWKKENLENHLKEKFGLSFPLEEVDEPGVSDYAFLTNIYENWGYIDIYFLKIPYSNKDIYITEIHVSEE